MFKKNEMLKTAILTGLVLFATIGLFTIVMDGTVSPAQAFMRQMYRGGGIAAPGDTLSDNQACACDGYR